MKRVNIYNYEHWDHDQEHLPAVNNSELYNAIMECFKFAGYEDGGNPLISLGYLPPFVVGGNSCAFYFTMKQVNNGTSWVLTLADLPIIDGLTLVMAFDETEEAFELLKKVADKK